MFGYEYRNGFDYLTSTKIEDISHSVPKLLKYILVRGPINEILSVLKIHSPVEVFDKFAKMKEPLATEHPAYNEI